MPNTKSASKRVRSNERKQLVNQQRKSRVRTLEKSYRAAVASGSKEEATAALGLAVSAIDKAVKGGVVVKGTANRKKSRLSSLLVGKA